jgi:cytochrome c oxidase subunit II
MSPTNIFALVSTPADSIFGLSVFVFSIVAGIFVVVFALLLYAVVRFRSQSSSSAEPAQIYGSTRAELASTVIPVLIVVALFLATARVIGSVQNPPRPQNAIEGRWRSVC